MRSLLKHSGILMIALLTAGCSEMQTGRSDTIYLARVGNARLTLQDARQEIPTFTYHQDSLKALARFRDQWIKEQIMLNEVSSLQLAQQEKVRQRLIEARKQVLLNALQDVILAEYQRQVRVTDREALQYYREYHERLILSERYVRFRHVEHSDINALREARDYLRSDSAWSDVARRFSLNAEDKISQAQQYHPVSTVLNTVPIMNRYLASLDSGQISPIQRHDGIYHLVQVTDVREQGEEADPEWFMDELKEWLLREKQRKYYNSYLKNLYFSAKEDNEIEVYNVTTPNLNDTIDSIAIPQANQ